MESTYIINDSTKIYHSKILQPYNYNVEVRLQNL